MPSPAEAVALRPGAPSPGPATDLAYRLYGLFASGGKNLLDDSRYSVPATSPAAMSGAVALLNTRARGPL